MIPSRLAVPVLLLLAACRPATPAAAPAGPTAPPATVRVEVWHDLVCPWCRIGLHNLETAVDGAADLRVEVVHHAFQLEPGAPQSGTDMRGHLVEKFGADKVDALLARVTAAGAQSGVHFDWSAVKVSPNTAAAHALLAWAPEERRRAVLHGLHAAHFDEGRNLGDPEVLAAVAAAAGLDASAARAAVQDSARLAAVAASGQDAARRGITGVPYFLVGGKVLNGAQSPAALSAALHAAVAGRAP